ncbi:MAG: mechanosensitive ion channel family protein [Chloroflexota bacterium]
MFNTDSLQIIFRLYILPILIFYALAYVVHRLSGFIARRFKPVNLINGESKRRGDRQQTLQALIASAVSVLGFLLATVFSLSLFVDAATLVWMIGLFSAAFGLGARPFIADFLTGISFIFEDIFDVGDKIEIPLFPSTIEGVVERVTLRITQVRGMDGELFTMPNGDIRLVRNFSRGEISRTSVIVKVPSASVGKAIAHLELLGDKAMTRLPNLVEPWQVISETGTLDDASELTVLAKAKFGKGAELRTRMMAMLQDELAHAEILPKAKVDDKVAIPTD